MISLNSSYAPLTYAAHSTTSSASMTRMRVEGRILRRGVFVSKWKSNTEHSHKSILTR